MRQAAALVYAGGIFMQVLGAAQGSAAPLAPRHGITCHTHMPHPQQQPLPTLARPLPLATRPALRSRRSTCFGEPAWGSCAESSSR
jgi:hypothetical protein